MPVSPSTPGSAPTPGWTPTADSTLIAGPTPTPLALPSAFGWNVPILAYHWTVCFPARKPENVRYLYVCPDLFRAQLQALLDDGWQFITAAQFATAFERRQRPRAKTVVITIDGTEAGDYQVAFPILRDLGVKATFFVSPGRVGQPGNETWTELAEMHVDGQDIENHGMYHRALTRLHGSALLHEVADASDAIEARLGYRPSAFCYANGEFNAEVMAAVSAAGGLNIAPITRNPVPVGRPLESFAEPLLITRLSARPVTPEELLAQLRPYQWG